jgi:hypothetical protein
MPKVAFQIAELPPRFHMQALTTEEQHAAWLVQSNLSAFESHVRAFGAAPIFASHLSALAPPMQEIGLS